ncbi:hypothetical protein NQ314_018767 [Rhamnusium bicolor]|uniref:Uncharacterized protein n=1 Tax=Rhamnusium bicolor TaxID=1586634 RepID=A0AAV8WQ89_9CUCU|nr:hypothetical protein NQ314_018767 [Rhamnusium bicolor]
MCFSKADERNEAASLKKIENYDFIMLLVFPLQNFTDNRRSPKALQYKITDLSQASKRLEVCLEELKKYRHEFEDLKTKPIS